MSMSSTLYVGPYIEAECPTELVSKYNNIVCCGQGESRIGSKWYLIPNQKMPGIDRIAYFNEPGSGEIPPIPIDDIQYECQRLTELAENFIKEVTAEQYGVAIVRWGIINGCS